MSIITKPSEEAGKKAAYAAWLAEQFQKRQWNELQGMQAPFIQQGQQAFGLYQALTGAQGPAAQQAALQNFQMSQPAQFGLQQQLKGIQQNAAAQGGLFGGNRLIQEQATGTQAYQQDLANYIERLRAQAALGQQSASALGGVGAASGQGIGAAIQGQGDAAANALLSGAQAQQGVASGAGQIAGSLFAMFSDSALKDNVRKIGNYGDLGVYRWDWNDKAKELGLEGSSIGHIAQEVEKKYPELVIDMGGYRGVIYGEGRTMEMM